MGLTDEVESADEALSAVHAFAVEELSESERATVDRAIAHLDGLVFGRHSRTLIWNAACQPRTVIPPRLLRG
jgi:hypothetical protein